MKILCLGSLNLDHVYQVHHIVREGETISTSSYAQHLGGKGLNQSVALARSGACVYHAGQIGKDGEVLKNWLDENGVDTRFVRTVDIPTGHAMIQVDELGRNCIVIYGGANQQLTPDWIKEVLAHFEKGDLLVLQNEVNGLDEVIGLAKERGLRVVLNPSPITDGLLNAPVGAADLLILNEIEGAALSGCEASDEMVDALVKCYPHSQIVLTLGEHGAIYANGTQRERVNAFKVNAVDTTAAGDTFTGYFISAWSQGTAPAMALDMANRAAAVAVSKAGASQSIPTPDQVRQFKF